MILTLDIGNTRAKIVAFEDACPQLPVACPVADLAQTLERIVRAHPSIESLHWCSVGCDDDVTDNMLAGLGVPAKRLDPSRGVRDLHIDYRTPATLGADRLAAVMGARVLQPEGTLLVVDAGTCITYDVLTADNHFAGGNISPGVEMRLAALHEHTARLPRVAAQGETPLLGFDTITAMRSGVMHGIAYEIEGYIRRLEQQYVGICTFLTGGDRPDFLVSPKSRIFADDYLVSRGLATDF